MAVDPAPLSAYSREAALAALQWYIDNGVDEVMGDSPLSRYGLGFAPAPQKQPVSNSASASSITSVTAPMGASEGRQQALALAKSAASLEELRAAIAAFDGITIKKTAMNMVFGHGNPKARVLVIGDVPAADDDKSGLPLQGAAGHLFDKMLASIGLDRQEQDSPSSVYVTNILNWRPPGNRAPSQAELDMSLPFIERHIQLIAPDFIVTLGALPAQCLLARSESLSKLRQKKLTYTPQAQELVIETASCPLLVTFSPDYLLNAPAQKRDAWTDLQTLQAALAE
jgi:DNA polymerase